MSPAAQTLLAQQVAAANALLACAVQAVREDVRERIESGSETHLIGDDELEPIKTFRTGVAIDCELEGIELIRQIEEHLGFCPCPGPAWFDEVVAQGASWAERQPCPG